MYIQNTKIFLNIKVQTKHKPSLETEIEAGHMWQKYEIGKHKIICSFLEQEKKNSALSFCLYLIQLQNSNFKCFFRHTCQQPNKPRQNQWITKPLKGDFNFLTFFHQPYKPQTHPRKHTKRKRITEKTKNKIQEISKACIAVYQLEVAGLSKRDWREKEPKSLWEVGE